MWLVKKYKEAGGKYTNESDAKKNTTRWLQEEWIQVVPYIEKNQIIACGKDNKNTKGVSPIQENFRKHTSNDARMHQITW